MNFKIKTISDFNTQDTHNFLKLYQLSFPHKKISKKTIQKILNEKFAQVWLAYNVSQDAMGFLYFWDVFEEVQILDIGTHPDFRKTGVASFLLNALVQNTKTQKIVLEVSEKNLPAQKLYEKFGFVKTITRAKYYPNQEDAWVYEKD